MGTPKPVVPRSRLRAAKRRVRVFAAARPREVVEEISKSSLHRAHAQYWNIAHAVRLMSELRLSMLAQFDQSYGDYFLSRQKEKKWSAQDEKWLRRQLSKIAREQKILLHRIESMKRLEQRSLEWLKKVKQNDFREFTDAFADFKDAQSDMASRQREYYAAKSKLDAIRRSRSPKLSETKAYWEAALRAAIAVQTVYSQSWKSFHLYGITFSPVPKSKLMHDLREINKTVRRLRQKIKRLDSEGGPPLSFS